MVITGVNHPDKRGVDDLEESYSDNQSMGVPDKVLSNLQYRWYEYSRKRYGAAANFDARATEATTLYLRVLWSGYLEGGHKQYLVFNNLDDSSQGFCTPLSGCIQEPEQSERLCRFAGRPGAGHDRLHRAHRERPGNPGRQQRVPALPPRLPRFLCGRH